MSSSTPAWLPGGSGYNQVEVHLGPEYARALGYTHVPGTLGTWVYPGAWYTCTHVPGTHGTKPYPRPGIPGTPFSRVPGPGCSLAAPSVRHRSISAAQCPAWHAPIPRSARSRPLYRCSLCLHIAVGSMTTESPLASGNLGRSLQSGRSGGVDFWLLFCQSWPPRPL